MSEPYPRLLFLSFHLKFYLFIFVRAVIAIVRRLWNSPRTDATHPSNSFAPGIATHISFLWVTHGPHFVYFLPPIFKFARKIIHLVGSFFSVYFCQLLIPRFSDSAVRTKFSRAVGPGSNLCRAIHFYDFTNICQKFQWFP